MKPLGYRYTTRAVDDLESILDPLTISNPQAADRLAEAIDKTILLVRTHPSLGERVEHPRGEGIRRLLVDRYRNYTLYYEVREETLIVVRILHNARDTEELTDQS